MGASAPMVVRMNRDRWNWALAASIFLHTLLLWLPLGRPSGPPGTQQHSPLVVHFAAERPKGGQAVPSVQVPLAPRAAAANAHASLAEEPARPSPVETTLALRYYRSGEVDIRAEPLAPPPIVIPESAYLARVTATIRLRVFVTENGEVAAAEIISTPIPDVYDKAVLEAIFATRFAPASLNGRPVRNVKEIEIRLDPYETIGQP